MAHYSLDVYTGYRSDPFANRITTLLEGRRVPGSAFPHFQVGFQTGQEVYPGPACPLINLGEPTMVEDQLGPVVDRLKLPGDAGPCPLWRAFGNPVHFLVPVQFGHLKLHDKRPLPKAKFSKRAHFWFDSRLVGPPLNDFVLLSYGAPDALRGGFYSKFLDYSCHRCSFLFS